MCDDSQLAGRNVIDVLQCWLHNIWPLNLVPYTFHALFIPLLVQTCIQGIQVKLYIHIILLMAKMFDLLWKYFLMWYTVDECTNETWNCKCIVRERFLKQNLSIFYCVLFFMCNLLLVGSGVRGPFIMSYIQIYGHIQTFFFTVFNNSNENSFRWEMVAWLVLFYSIKVLYFWTGSIEGKRQRCHL
jgi:hypothetical protein